VFILVYTFWCTHLSVHILVYTFWCSHLSVHILVYTIWCAHLSVHILVYTSWCTHLSVYLGVHILVYTSWCPSWCTSWCTHLGVHTIQPSTQSQVELMSKEELDVLNWGKNANAVSPPKGVDSKAYKKATALEVLVSVYVVVRSCVELARIVYIHTVYDRIFGYFPAKNTVYIPCIYTWFWPTLFMAYTLTFRL